MTPPRKTPRRRPPCAADSPTTRARRVHRLLRVPIVASVAVCSVYLPAAPVEVTDSNGTRIADAVVALTPEHGEVHAETVRESIVIDQIDKTFVPHVSVVRTGGSVRFPNSDDIRHHVYSFSRPNDFELPLYSGEPTEPRRFDAPGKVVMGCNIHDTMQGFLYVLDAPYVAVTGEAGIADIEVPAGRYRVEVYHPRARVDPAVRTSVDIASDRTAPVGVSIALQPPPPPEPEGELTELERKFLELRRAHH